jgi:hypothetical protein
MLMFVPLSLFTRPQPSSMSWPGAVLLWLSFVLPLAASAAEMQDAVKESFVGTWELRSVMMDTADGRTTPVWGDHPVGRLVYEANGRMFALLMPEARNQASGRGIPEALQGDVAGYYGSYIVDTTRHVVTHRVEASVRAAESGTIERTFSMQPGRLTLTARAVRDGVPVTYVLTWERMRP